MGVTTLKHPAVFISSPTSFGRTLTRLFAVAPVAAVPKRPQSIIFGGRAFIFKVDLVT